jgi:DNA-binding response OmpR family regulator
MGVMAKSVLIADDEPNIILSLKFIMEQAGYHVRVARDGDDALAQVAQQPPDLVLLDVMMPRLTGYDVCEAIRANPDYAGTRIIMVTAKGREAEREKGLAVGADDYVTKPFSTRDVLQQVQTLLESPE